MASHDAGESPDAPEQEPLDADMAADANADTSARDAATEAAADAASSFADWDAAASPLLDQRAFAEVKNSFKLEAPAPLAMVYQSLAADTRDVRLFLNALKSSSTGVEVHYGAAFMEQEGPRFQYPEQLRSFRAAPSQQDPQTLISEPFDYQLYAWVPKPSNPSVGYQLQLSASHANWVARFDASFERIEQGSLTAVMKRAETEAAPLRLDFALCLAACKNASKCGSGVAKLADLLDCNDTKLDADADGDGINDGYRLRITFRSERVLFPMLD